jgi:carbamoyl-phosphate synthase large subunit
MSTPSRSTEDREKFRKMMGQIGVSDCKAETAKSFLEGKEIAQEIGFPLVHSPIVHPGWYGGGIVNTPAEFDKLLTRGLHALAIHEVWWTEHAWAGKN